MSARVEVSREDETGVGHYTITHLSYQRYNGKFRIVVSVRPYDAISPEDEKVRSWAESTRDEKIESLEKLPELLVALAKQVEEHAIKAEQAVAAVSAFVKPSAKGGA